MNLNDFSLLDAQSELNSLAMVQARELDNTPDFDIVPVEFSNTQFDIPIQIRS